MTEKLNPHNKTPRFYYHNTPPFYFIPNNLIIFFKICSNLAYLKIQDFAKNFDPYCYEIYTDGTFLLYYDPRSPSIPFVPLGVVEVFKTFENGIYRKIYVVIKFFKNYFFPKYIKMAPK